MEKKEIGKLLELLNEYSKKIGYFNADDLQGQVKTWILSKEFGWIERLVEQDKIDLDKVEKKFYNEICITDYGDKDRIYGEADLVIAVLSISDTPIDDLISYLK